MTVLILDLLRATVLGSIGLGGVRVGAIGAGPCCCAGAGCAAVQWLLVPVGYAYWCRATRRSGGVVFGSAHIGESSSSVSSESGAGGAMPLNALSVMLVPETGILPSCGGAFASAPVSLRFAAARHKGLGTCG